MAKSAYGIITLLRWLIALFICATLCTLFIYSPFYAKTSLWLLSRYVPVEVNLVAAESQRFGQLNADNKLEPGSAEWLARRAFLYEMNLSLQEGESEDFFLLQYRYEKLLAEIEIEKIQKDLHKNSATPIVLQPVTEFSAEASSSDSQNKKFSFYPYLMEENNEPLFQKYREFLREDQNLSPVNLEVETTKFPQPLIFTVEKNQPYAIVVLGGGLKAGAKPKEIVVNRYTEKRLEEAVKLYKKHPLPILLSGVEAPYMQEWLKKQGIEAQFLEHRSMNTCENTRFTALLLQKQGGAPTVYLITDAYHMPRSQRLFAHNGLVTVAVNASLPNELTEWQPDSINLMHSRRATYEILAIARDLWFGESNCREIP